VGVHTEWTAGGVAEVGFMVGANHGGGYVTSSHGQLQHIFTFSHFHSQTVEIFVVHFSALNCSGAAQYHVFTEFWFEKSLLITFQHWNCSGALNTTCSLVCLFVH
jgi:hypothetical protein